MYYVYILKSKKDNGYYIGQTNDLENRLRWHNQGLVKSTKNRTPFEVIYSEIFKTRGEAMKREKCLKKMKGGNELKKILKSKTK